MKLSIVWSTELLVVVSSAAFKVRNSSGKVPKIEKARALFYFNSIFFKVGRTSTNDLLFYSNKIVLFCCKALFYHFTPSNYVIEAR